MEKIAESCEIAVGKTGAKGALIKSKNEVIHVPARKVNSIDTTGAGDIYAAGFIYGLSRNLALEKCGQIGTLLASRVIQVIGPKIEDNDWISIKKEINV